MRSKPTIWSLVLIALMLLGGLLRLLDLDDPPLDFQPSRQMLNLLVAREIYYSLNPDPTPEERELASTFARSVGQYEPPIIESMAALSYFVSGGETIAAARLWQTLFWLAA